MLNYKRCIIFEYGVHWYVQHTKSNETLHTIDKPEAIRIAGLLDFEYRLLSLIKKLKLCDEEVLD